VLLQVSAARQRGAALLTVLFLVVLLGLAAGLAGQALRDYIQREREEELLWRGEQYRRAIASYVNAQGRARIFPTNLEDLLRDPRFPGVVRHLRRLYDDPMVGQAWEPVRDAANQIVGVRSTSVLKPFRQDGFPEELDSFRGKNSYRDWEFVYAPTRTTSRPPSSGGSAFPLPGGSQSP